ncbi:hypothetical protein SAMN05660420_01245 [Desulfuromusa kysingii]|uniref:Oligosaccharide repeat unit polymerase n=1 Tax=Desulfuromusa kysingii TaxID=37625 RepID=A0A1H3YHP5_9BACT|nr:hypothetical protein [Desulfuromusa kysingii]SEA11065.1 hypothetical protein SAMN05660420_01245 [Desulfuromusa kysingii]
MIFSILFCLIIFTVAVWRIESRCRFILTPFMVLMYFELVRILPAFVLSQNPTLNLASSGYPLLVASCAFFFLVVGFVLGYFYRPTGADRVLALTAAGGSRLTLNRNETIGVFVLAMLLAIVGFWFYRGVPVTLSSLVSLFGGGAQDAAMMVRDQRYLLTKSHYFGGEYRGQGIVRILMFQGWTLICCFTLIASMERKTARSIIMFLISLIAAWLFVAGDGSRGNFLNLLIVLTIAYSIRRPLSMRTLLFIGSFIVMMGISLSLYSTKGHQYLSEGDGQFFTNMGSMIFDRIFLGNARNDIFIIELVKSGVWDLRWGGIHLRDAISSIPSVQYGMPLSYELSQYQDFNLGKTTFSSGTYLSKVFADFGLWGVPPIFLLIGFSIGLIQRWVFRPVSGAWSTAKLALIIFLAGALVSSGFIGVISKLVILIIISLFHSLFIGSIKWCRRQLNSL